ncbi:hypothetical protein ACFSKU_15560 [Pontibacter silvestris]|uniref:DUF3575 domain-containing protein n=1 Tax=Pontibacter silvestris TaxID=2305183 RepID=A0ABW4X2B3_9BACT|nr:hypothetical protein [Pontibacter silvestris]MCC9137543.1 hypothetical protein [Pontibacter silvestris]
MKARLLLPIVVLLMTSCVAQAQNDLPVTVTKRLYKINFFTLGLEFEQALGKSSTFNINPNISFGLDYHNERDYNAYLWPSLELQTRGYYNLNKRSKAGKNVSDNSGNFIALSIYGNTPSLIEHEESGNEASYGVGPVWGMQRNFNSGLNLTVTAGAGYGKDKFGDEGLTPLLRLNLGFLLGRGR